MTKMIKARKKPFIITVEEVDEIKYLDKNEGILKATEKDYIITGTEGERYPIKKDIFKETYDIVETLEEGKKWTARKKPTVIIYAREVEQIEFVDTLEGTMKANVGDYIVTGVRGEQYPIKGYIFKKNYEFLD